MALCRVVEAQEIGQGDSDLRTSPEGWARFQASMAQAKESIHIEQTSSETITNGHRLTAIAI